MVKIAELKKSKEAIEFLKQQIDAFEIENKKLQLENEYLKKRHDDPKKIVERIFKRGIEWYDWNSELIPIEERRSNFRDAKFMLESQLFNNIRNYIIATGAQTAFLEEQHDTNKIRDFQMTINGIELLFKMLESVSNPDAVEKPTTNDIYNGV